MMYCGLEMNALKLGSKGHRSRSDGITQAENSTLWADAYSRPTRCSANPPPIRVSNCCNAVWSQSSVWTSFSLRDRRTVRFWEEAGNADRNVFHSVHCIDVINVGKNNNKRQKSQKRVFVKNIKKHICKLDKIFTLFSLSFDVGPIN